MSVIQGKKDKQQTHMFSFEVIGKKRPTLLDVDFSVFWEKCGEG
jgi:hypothetical protein